MQGRISRGPRRRARRGRGRVAGAGTRRRSSSSPSSFIRRGSGGCPPSCRSSRTRSSSASRRRTRRCSARSACRRAPARPGNAAGHGRRRRLEQDHLADPDGPELTGGPRRRDRTAAIAEPDAVGRADHDASARAVADEPPSRAQSPPRPTARRRARSPRRARRGRPRRRPARHRSVSASPRSRSRGRRRSASGSAHHRRGPCQRRRSRRSTPRHVRNQRTAPVFDERSELQAALDLMAAKNWSGARQALHALAARVPQSKQYRALLCYTRGREAQAAGRGDEAATRVPARAAARSRARAGQVGARRAAAPSVARFARAAGL